MVWAFMHALAHSMLLPTPDMKPSGLSDACASDPPMWMGGGFALAFFPSDISSLVRYWPHARSTIKKERLIFDA